MRGVRVIGQLTGGSSRIRHVALEDLGADLRGLGARLPERQRRASRLEGEHQHQQSEEGEHQQNHRPSGTQT